MRKISECQWRVLSELLCMETFPSQAGDALYNRFHHSLDDQHWNYHPQLVISYQSFVNAKYQKPSLQTNKYQNPSLHTNSWEPVGKVARLILYPVKSLAGVQVQLSFFGWLGNYVVNRKINTQKVKLTMRKLTDIEKPNSGSTRPSIKDRRCLWPPNWQAKKG